MSEMLGRKRPYNPGRDDRHRLGRDKISPYRHVQLGACQVEANKAAIEETGEPLGWRRYPAPIEAMMETQRWQVQCLCQDWPDVNQLRQTPQGTFWYLRPVPGFYDDESAVDLPPQTVQVASQQPSLVPIGGQDFPRPVRDRLAKAIAAGGEEIPAEQRELLVRLHQALTAPCSMREALRFHLGEQVRDRVDEATTVMPQLRLLAAWI